MNKYRVRLEQKSSLVTVWEGNAETLQAAVELALVEASKIGITNWAESEPTVEATSCEQVD